MKNSILEKDKYIVYNQEYKILVFVSTTAKGYQQISFPGKIVSGYEKDATGEFYEKIRNLTINKQDIIYLNQVICERDLYESRNKRLNIMFLKSIRKYYSYYKKFSDEDYKNIMELCYARNIMPYFLTIEELKYLISTKKFLRVGYNIDVFAQDALNELEKRLKFIKY